MVEAQVAPREPSALELVGNVAGAEGAGGEANEGGEDDEDDIEVVHEPVATGRGSLPEQLQGK